MKKCYYCILVLALFGYSMPEGIPNIHLHDLKLIVDRSYQLQAAFLYRSSDEPLLSIFLLVLRTPDKESHQS